MIDRALIALVVASTLAWPASAQQAPDPTDPADPASPTAPETPFDGAPTDTAAGTETPNLTEEQAKADLLDALFERLAQPEADDWQRVQNQINALWNESGSASMDLLARRADKAMHGEDFATALLHLDDLVRLAPDFAEGWNKRATIYFLQGEYGASLEDIARTLKLEPRHFGALAGLGVILDRVGDSEGALEAYRRAVRIHPHLEGAREGIKKLQKEVEGQRL